MKNIFLFAVVILIGCVTTVVQPEQQAASSSTATISVDQALDKSFTSQKYGILLRYPSTIYDTQCSFSLPVTASESDRGIEFTYPMHDGGCAPVPSEVGNISHIALARAIDDQDVQNFIDRVFPQGCEESERSEYGNIVRIFLHAKSPAIAEREFQCSESILWNKNAAIVLFSNLASKKGGGYEWPSLVPIEMPDGSTENGYDFAVMQSIQYPESL